ncbi:MAG TPA: menaquinone biosynthesis decarboxylase [Bacteroidales bacterium]|nr:menaquinone biosynthesis decarboxylase [Bacteroidales bacterium]
MAYQGLLSFIEKLESSNELLRIKTFVDPVLEITEINDRIVKSDNNKALLFENNGSKFPVLINAFGSDLRISLALQLQNPESAAKEIDCLISELIGQHNEGFIKKLATLPKIARLTGIMPSYSRQRGSCQDVIIKQPDLGILPVLKCWPHDGGRFITLPMVHTINPETGQMNVGMYRMQILDKNTTAMHWQRHKTGANHFEAWKGKGKKMPVSVALGGDPVYTYAATAPLPENINEYILAGFLRKKKVKLVKCITNDIYVPNDADIVIEGFVDPSESPVWEGPFGDHTGFYSLADWYPKFHVTCITHSRRAVYPATIVGIPPQEDAFFALATEKIFLSPIKFALVPEVIDLHMPVAGTAHNLVIVKIDKKYPGQGLKVFNSLAGAGQMMFSKYILIVSGNVDIRNYRMIARQVFLNTDLHKDILFSRGPLDVLDHASDVSSFGGKAAIDATVKLAEEKSSDHVFSGNLIDIANELKSSGLVHDFNSSLIEEGIHILIISINPSKDPESIHKVAEYLKSNIIEQRAIIVAVDHSVDVNDFFVVAWQTLANTDPQRDHMFICNSILFDATIKLFSKVGFDREWPNVVYSDRSTIEIIDNKWSNLGLGNIIESPSLKYMNLGRKGNDRIVES